MRYFTLMLALCVLFLVVRCNTNKPEIKQEVLDSCKFKYHIVLQYDVGKKTVSQYSAVCDSFQMEGKSKIDIWNNGVRSHIEAERVIPFTN